MGSLAPFGGTIKLHRSALAGVRFSAPSRQGALGSALWPVRVMSFDPCLCRIFAVSSDFDNDFRNFASLCRLDLFD